MGQISEVAVGPDESGRRLDPTAILRCPVSGQSLRPATAAEVESARRVLAGATRGSTGLEPTRGYVTADGRLFYPEHDDIFFLLSHLAVPLDGAQAGGAEAPALRDEKRRVQEFYDDFGWQLDAGGAFGDTRAFVDDRPLSRDYARRCNLRVGQHVRPSGTYLLDVACGAIPLPEYLTYSERYDRRVCVDLSLAALRQARAKLGQRGVYVLGDITNLPLRDDSVDGVVSLHTLYHVPADEQLRGLQELHRVLAPGATAAVVYSWGNHAPVRRIGRSWRLLRRWATAPLRRLRRALGGESSAPARQGASGKRLYFHPHPRAYFVAARERLGLDLEVLSFQTVDKAFTERWIHPWLLGRWLLAGLFWLEGHVPRLMGRFGLYPLLVLRK